MTVRIPRWVSRGGLLLWIAAIACGWANTGDAATFRWANTGDAVSMDPYNVNETFTFGFTGNFYDGLVARGKDLKIGPGLATSWKTLDPNTWEFKLRKGVKFQGGEDFTSDDVVFSYKRALSPGSQINANFVSIVSVEATDPYTVIIKTKQPNPILLADISFWWILSKKWCEANNATEVADVRKAATNFATTHANGTGAYILVSREADVKTVAKKNPDWWGWKTGFGKSNADEVVFTPIKQDGTRVAALLSGSTDMLYEVPIQDLDRIRSGGGKVFQAPETRTIFLGMDQFRDELIDSSVKGKNPFKDRRVRLALYKAIDEDSIVKNIMRGAATSATGFVVKEAAGYDPNFKRLGYNPDEAKKLLADAGYPNGFEVGFDCPNDRYVNDAQICQAVAAMWARIGIKANLNAQTKSLHFGKIARFETSIYMLGWAPGTIDGQNVLDNLLVTNNAATGYGHFNYGRYSNPEMDAIATESRGELNVTKRTALLEKALDLAHTDVGTIPLHYQQVIWVAGSNVSLVQRADNIFGWCWVNMQ
jgi:peptide/nickel transport system substrate-binding protein